MVYLKMRKVNDVSTVDEKCKLKYTIYCLDAVFCGGSLAPQKYSNGMVKFHDFFERPISCNRKVSEKGGSKLKKSASN